MYPTSRKGNNLQFPIHHGTPLPLRWWGWETTTHALYGQGWTFLAEESPDMYGPNHLIRLAAKSPDGHMIITGQVVMRYDSIYAESYPVDSLFRRGMNMQVYTSRDVFRNYTMDHPEFKSLNSIKPINIFAETYHRLSDNPRTLKCFEYTNDATKELFIPPSSVDKCLDMILQMQYPEQKEIKKGLVVPERKPIIQAKIFTLAA